ncbi:MAG TPA: Holliday junction resolvase RuvX [Pyrinomonadaceae bacterium]
MLAIDPGRKRVGLAVSDELRLTARPLSPLRRSNWKDLLQSLSDVVRRFDVKTVVIGLPLLLEGAEGDAAEEARRFGRNLQLSLNLPVYFQDERLTSREAEETLRAEGYSESAIAGRIDGEAARLILLDFISHSS